MSTETDHATLHDVAALIVVGSDDARRAVAVVGQHLHGGRVVVVHVWQGAAPRPTAGVALGAALPPTPEEEQEAERRARDLAEQGAGHARRAGLQADAVLAHGAGADQVAQALLAQADDRDADVIVVGRRGLSRLKALVLGSVADAVVRQTYRPVLVVPAPG